MKFMTTKSTGYLIANQIGYLIAKLLYGGRKMKF